MKNMENMKRVFKKALFLCVSVMMFAGCGDNGTDSIEMSAVNRKPPPISGLELKTLNVFYGDDTEKAVNLISFNPKTGSYTVAEAVSDHLFLVVEAEAEAAAAKTLISWVRGSEKGSSEAGQGPAALDNIPLPGIIDGEKVNTVITVTVVKDKISYPYTITVSAPGANSLLKELSFRYLDDSSIVNTSDEYWKTGWENELLYTLVNAEKYTAFDGSSQYIVEMPAKDKARAGTDIAVTALAQDGRSVLTLKLNGEYRLPALPDPKQGASANAGRRDDAAAAAAAQEGDVQNGENSGEEKKDETPVDALNHRWIITAPNAGGESLTIVLELKNDEVFSRYTVTLVPPPDDTDNKDTRLSNIQFEDENGKFIIPQTSEAGGFNSNTTTYQFSTSQYKGPVKIVSCVPSHKNADVAITYTDDNGGTYPINYPAFTDVKIPLPAKDKNVVVDFRVKIGGDEANAREYTVTFTNPTGSFLWKGTVALSGGNASRYTITGLDAVTQDGASHTVTVENGKWQVEISEKQAGPDKPPVSFTAALLKDDGKKYRLSTGDLSGIKPDTDKDLSFDTSGSAENPLYFVVYTANDLKDIGKTPGENYYLSNNINLTELGDWNGPSDYKGRFNGNGKTITLILSKPSGDTGLFNSLASGAVIENLNVQVSTKNNSLNISGSSHFGGVVGNIWNGDFTIRNVSVSGSLKCTNANGYFLAGGLIGEINENRSNGMLQIENCKSALDIELDAYNTDNIIGIGQFAGKISGNNANGKVIIKNCVADGSIKVKASGGRLVLAGGFVGANSAGAGDLNVSAVTFTMENCYAATSVEVARTNTSSTKTIAAGGLIGIINNSGNSIVTKSAALNPKVTAVSGNPGGSGVFVDRVIGRKNTGTLTDLYALKGMITGTSGEGKPNNSEGALNSPAGFGKDAAFFKDKNNWTKLGFSETNWDFTGIANGYPTLKLK
ncbi:MAG: hypothetical protein LBC27_03180 [Spirochaetaceae bacterium]|jgi:hypothetical protein|nr:hypothetical protein [Spirochaetaceae bacterium]